MSPPVDQCPRPTLDPRSNRIVAALTRRLAQAARTADAVTPPRCAHDFLVAVLRPDFVQSEASEDAASRW